MKVKGWKTRGHIEPGQEGEREHWKGEKAQSESRCGVKTEERKRQRLINGQREMTNAWETCFLPSVPSNVEPSQPSWQTSSSSTLSAPPASPPFILPLSSSSVLYGTQLLIHSPCITTHLPQVRPERTLQSSMGSSQSALKLCWATRSMWKCSQFINLIHKLGLQLTCCKCYIPSRFRSKLITFTIQPWTGNDNLIENYLHFYLQLHAHRVWKTLSSTTWFVWRVERDTRTIVGNIWQADNLTELAFCFTLFIQTDIVVISADSQTRSTLFTVLKDYFHPGIAFSILWLSDFMPSAELLLLS